MTGFVASNRSESTLNSRNFFRCGTAIALCLTLAACDENGQFSLGELGGAEAPAEGVEVSRAATSVELVERDVEAPDVFQVTENGLWDGRPSLGGVWVAHPDVTDPERVIIRNRDNGKFVIGALFRRERDNPGPALQVSSDAANALGLLPGAPTNLNVTALRREEVPENPTLALDTAPTDALDAPTEIAATALAPATEVDPIAGAAAAIEAAEVTPAVADAAPSVEAAATPVATPVATPAAAASSLQKPFIQIGIFSVEANASGTAQRMRNIGIIPTVLAQESQGKPFWRVIVGPAQDSAQRATLLESVKAEGFSDAYFVTN